MVVPWHREAQRDAFLTAWGVVGAPDWLVLQQDATGTGCGATKNAGVMEALERGADLVVVLDDDCYPLAGETLPTFAAQHAAALEPQPVTRFRAVTSPPSRGTPYGDQTVTMPVAASMGFWEGIGDYCAVRQLAYQAAPMAFHADPIYGQYFPLSGMNLAFRPRTWLPWCRFIDVPRFDDIWMGWLWQHEAYRRGACFNLNGPRVRHARQSNVWRNLDAETRYLEANERLWAQIATSPSDNYFHLRQLLPT